MLLHNSTERRLYVAMCEAWTGVTGNKGRSTKPAHVHMVHDRAMKQVLQLRIAEAAEEVRSTKRRARIARAKARARSKGKRS